MNSKEVLKHFEGRLESMISDIRAIVDIESPSYNTAQSTKVVDRIVDIAHSIPLEVSIERVPAENFGEHLVIRAFPSDEKSILLLGHTDTVHPIGACEKNPTRIDGDKFYGCGIFDMKANIVLMLEALYYFAETGSRPASPITILLSCDEEIGSRTGKPLVEREASRSEACFVFEPSLDGKVKTGRKGTGMFTLRAHGIPAHAGLEPEKGASAILELSRQIERLHSLNAPDIGTTVNVCVVKGGTATNVIPEYAECEIDIRFSTMNEASRIEAALRALRPVDDRVSLELLGEINRPPMERTAAVAALYERARDLAASFDYELGEAQVGGGSDGNFVAALGVTVLDGLGISGAGAHTLHEHILVSDIAKRATLVTLFLMNG
jgi:glutamate carboxypeptidase